MNTIFLIFFFLISLKMNSAMSESRLLASLVNLFTRGELVLFLIYYLAHMYDDDDLI
jgi:hypothetical protein